MRGECIAMNWDVMSGEPCIKGTRIPTHVPMNYFIIGKSVREIAAIFRLKIREVEEAIRFEHQLTAKRQKRPRAKKPVTTRADQTKEGDTEYENDGTD